MHERIENDWANISFEYADTGKPCFASLGGRIIALGIKSTTMLTKSDLASYRQCPRKLWLEHNRPDLIPQNDTTLWRRANDGNIVGAKARELLGPNAIWPQGGTDPASAARDAIGKLSVSPHQPAVEGPMFREGLYARADALIPVPSGGYILRETKASTFPLKKGKVTPDNPEEHH